MRRGFRGASRPPSYGRRRDEVTAVAEKERVRRAQARDSYSMVAAERAMEEGERQQMARARAKTYEERQQTALIKKEESEAVKDRRWQEEGETEQVAMYGWVAAYGWVATYGRLVVGRGHDDLGGGTRLSTCCARDRHLVRVQGGGRDQHVKSTTLI